MSLKITDTHLHLWNTDKLTYPWLESVPSINKTLSLEEFNLQTESLSQNTDGPQLEKLVFMQCECLASQYLDEVNYITSLATKDKRIQGIIAWFPLEKNNIEKELQDLTQNLLIKGLRRLEESPNSLFENPNFLSNLDLLVKHELSFDICAQNHLLGPATKMVEKKPDVKFMLDHMGKPDIKNKETASWKKHIRLFAQNPNVYCKISGIVTEADLQNWHIDDLRPYFDYVVEQFGTDRLVFGGDWPVLTLASSYQKWVDTVLTLSQDFSKEDQNKLFSENANQFYKLS